MVEFYPWWVYLHVLGAFTFAAAHGTSAIVSFRIRSARGADEVRLLLNVSQIAVGVMYVGLLLLLIGGIVAGIVGDHFGRGWIWASLALLVVVMVAMYMLATPFYKRLRDAVGAEVADPRIDDPVTTVPANELDALVRSNRPVLLTVVGLGGFVVILWLMLLKPF